MAVGTVYKGLNVVLTATVGTFETNMRRAARATRDVDSEVKKLGKGADGIEKVSRSTQKSTKEFSSMRLAASAGTTAIVLGFAAAARAGLEFDRNMRNVNSLLTSNGLNAKQLERQYRQLSAGVIDLSKDLPQTANQLAVGLNAIIGAGVPAGQALATLEASGRAASAGLTDTVTASKAIVGVMNAYGPSAGNAEQVSDALFQTVNAGVISFEDLAQNIGDVVSLAASAKVPIQDVGAAIAALTRAGVVPAEATTQLRRLIQELVEPNDKLQAVYAKLGITSGATALQQEGLFNVMEKLRKATGGNIAPTLELFNDVRAVNGALVLASNSGQTYAETQKLVGDASARTGATERALAEQRKSVSFQLDVLRNKFAALGLAIFQDLRPALVTIIQGLAQLTGFLSENHRLVEALAVLYGVRFVASLGAVQRGFAAATLAARTFGISSVAAIGQTEAGAARAATASQRLTAALGGGPMIAATASVVGLSVAFDQLSKVSEKYAEQVVKPYDTNSLKGVRAAIEELNKELEKTDKAEASRRNNRDVGIGFSSVERLHELLGGKQPSDALRKQLEDLKAKEQELAASTQQTATAFHGSASALFDQTAALKETAAETEKLSDSQKALQGLLQGISAPSTVYQQELQKIQDAQQKANERSTDSLQRSLDAQGDALDERHREQREALEASKNDVANNSKGAKLAIEDELKTLTKKQRAETEAFQAQRKNALDGQKAVEDNAKATTVSLARLIGAQQKANQDLISYRTNIVKVAGRVGPDIAAQINEQFKSNPLQAAGLAEQLLKAPDAEVRAFADAMRQQMTLTSDDVVRSVDDAMKVAGSVGALQAGRQGAAISDAFSAGLKDRGQQNLAIARQYGLDLVAATDPILAQLGLARVGNQIVPLSPGTLAVQFGGASTLSGDADADIGFRKRAGGGFDLPSQATIAAGQGRGLVQWAEAETGGEAFIPLAEAKRGRSMEILAQTANHFGYGLAKFASGGFFDPLKRLPRPPGLPGVFMNSMNVGAMGQVYNANLINLAQSALASLGGVLSSTGILGNGDVGAGYQSILQHLSADGVPYTVTSTTGGKHAQNSLHYVGKAVDLVGPDMMAIFNDLLKYSTSMAELFYTPAGFSIDNGRRVAPIDAKGHYDHVHAATYDAGGDLQPGNTLVVNKTGKPESVITEARMDQLFKAIEARSGAQIIVQAKSESTEEVARKVSRKLR